MFVNEKVYIGSEIEYAGRNIQLKLDSKIDSLSLEREYYDWQIEYNNILFNKNTNTINNIYCMLTEINKTIIEKGKEIAKYLHSDDIIYISSIYRKIYNGYVFNGLHLHLSINKIRKYLNSKKLTIIRKYAIFMKYKYLNDFRFLASHHIWGAYRDSDYSFKRKNRYKPVILTSRYNTLEFRLFNYIDIFDKAKRRIAATILHNIVNYIYSGNMKYLKEINGKKVSMEKLNKIFNMLCNVHSENLPNEFLDYKNKGYQVLIYNNKLKKLPIRKNFFEVKYRNNNFYISL